MIEFPVFDWQDGWLPPQRMSLHGVWKNLRVWRNVQHLEDFKRGLTGISPIILPDARNGVTDLGIHHVENRFTDFANPEPTLAPWFAGLIDNAGFAGVSPGDTMASHSGWIENTDYDEAVRQTLVFGAAAARTISAQVQFTMNQIRTIQGLMVPSDSTKGASTGLLFSTALFASPVPLIVGNVLTANYALSD